MMGFSVGNKPWWDMPREGGADPALARAVVETCQDIENRQRSIIDGNRRHARIYAGYLPNGLALSGSAVSNARVPFSATKGLVRSVCDTATALIVRTRPRPSFVTDGADWEIQRQAEDMDQFTMGAYHKSGLYQVAPRSFHDSTVFGTGGWKYVERGEGDDYAVKAERILSDDIVVDEDECREHLEPQNIYHRVIVRTDALIKRFASGNSNADKDRRIKILAAQGADKWPNINVPKNHCVMVSVHHVDPDGGGNRKVICAAGVTLRDEPWPYDWHPYTFLWWTLPITGFYGDGVAYRQYGRQERITYLYRWIHRVQELFATPTAWVDPAGGPPTMQMSNEIGRIVMARRKPEFQVPQAVPPEIYSWLNELERGGYEDEGISQVTANNRLPPGIESAPAQREYSFKEGQRFAPVSQRWEDAVAVEPAYKMIAMYRRHFKDGKGKSIKWADRKFIHQVDWPNLDEDRYSIHPEAASLDSLSPAARTQSALELAQTGWITPQEGRDLLDHPDLRESNQLANAGETYAKMVLKQLIDGKPVQVDDYADLEALDRIIRRGRLLVMERHAPQEIVDNLARYLDDLDGVKQRMVQAAQATMPSPAGAPAPGLSTPAAQGMPAPFAGGHSIRR